MQKTKKTFTSLKNPVKAVKAQNHEYGLDQYSWTENVYKPGRGIISKRQQGEKYGCVLLEELKITQPTLTHHMKLLCDSDFMIGRKEGKWMYYSISPTPAGIEDPDFDLQKFCWRRFI